MTTMQNVYIPSLIILDRVMGLVEPKLKVLKLLKEDLNTIVGLVKLRI